MNQLFTIYSDTMTLILNADSFVKTRNQLRQMRLDNKNKADSVKLKALEEQLSKDENAYEASKKKTRKNLKTIGAS